MAMCAVFFFLRSYIHEISGDELIYQYCLVGYDTETKERIFGKAISSFSDVLASQRVHYMEANGRALIHTAEQCLSGPLGFVVFCVINTCIFILFIWLIVKYVSAGQKSESSYFLWLVTLLALLYLFPSEESLWTSINYGPNYHWPSVLSVSVLLLWRQIVCGNVSAKWNWAVALVSFLAGWSHEGFAVGLAGGTFIYYWLNFKRLPHQILWLVIPLWIGTAALVFAPGSIIRFFHRGEVSMNHRICGFLLNGIDNFLHLKIIWLALLLTVVEIKRHKNRMLSFIRNNILLLWVLCITICFTMIANTHPHTHTLVEVLCLLFLLGYLCECGCFNVMPGWQRVISIVLTLLFAAHQTVLCIDSCKISRFQHRMVEEYKTSPDGLVRYDAPELFPWSENFIRVWPRQLNVDDESFRAIRQIYGNYKKPLIFLWPEEYDAVAGKSRLFVPENRIPGTAPVYATDDSEYLWLHPDSVNPTDKFEYLLKPVDWHHDAPVLLCLKFALMPNSYPDRGDAKLDSIHTRYGTMYRFDRRYIMREAYGVDVKKQ